MRKLNTTISQHVPVRLHAKAALILVAVTLFAISCTSSDQRETSSVDDPIGRAFASRTSDVQVEGEGKVISILADDLDGSRHQRFIIQLQSGQTLLIAHNIDLAPRIDALKVGDSVHFNGEYVWNEKGGAIHWTHHDPQGSHVAGWVIHNGRKYQ